MDVSEETSVIEFMLDILLRSSSVATESKLAKVAHSDRIVSQLQYRKMSYIWIEMLFNI